MSPRHEVLAFLGLAALGAVTLLVTAPAIGVAVLAGAGAASLVGPLARVMVAVAVLLLGIAVLWLATARSDLALGAGGALVTVAAGVAAVRARRWPPARRGDGPTERRERTDRDTWEALDRGEDPTV